MVKPPQYAQNKAVCSQFTQRTQPTRAVASTTHMDSDVSEPGHRYTEYLSVILSATAKATYMYEEEAGRKAVNLTCTLLRGRLTFCRLLSSSLLVGEQDKRNKSRHRATLTKPKLTTVYSKPKKKK